MGLIKDYKIVNNDLYLTEHLFDIFDSINDNPVKIWQLVNVDKSDLQKDLLEKILTYNDDIDIEISKISNITQISLFAYNDHSEYIFKCDDLITTYRQYNEQEFRMIISIYQDYYSKEHAISLSKIRLINDLTQFLGKEAEKKQRIIDQLNDKSNISSIKANHQLDILKQIIMKIENK